MSKITKIKLIFCEDLPDSRRFKQRKTIIINQLKRNYSNLEINEIFQTNYTKSVDFINSLQLTNKDIISIDSNLGNGDDEGEKILDMLVKIEYKGFIIWHSVTNPPHIYKHICTYNKKSGQIGKEYKKWVEDPNNFGIRPITNYLIAMYILCQTFIIRASQQSSSLKNTTIIEDALSKMTIDLTSIPQVPDESNSINIYGSKWWYESLGISNKKEFDRAIEQESKILGLSIKNIDLKFEENIKPLSTAITDNSSINIDDVTKAYSFFNQLFN
jgi:hypothetical protein